MNSVLAAGPRPKDPHQYVRCRGRRFQARPYCEVEKTRYNLGSFPTPDQAATAIREFWKSGKGERARHVRRVEVAGRVVYEAAVRVPLGDHPTREQAEAVAGRFAAATAWLARACWRRAGGGPAAVDRRLLREVSRDGWRGQDPPDAGVYVRAGRRGEWTGQGPPPPRTEVRPAGASFRAAVLVRLGRFPDEATAARAVRAFVRRAAGPDARAILAGKEGSGKGPVTGRGSGWSKGLKLPRAAAAPGAGLAPHPEGRMVAATAPSGC